jgi:chitinase
LDGLSPEKATLIFLNIVKFRMNGTLLKIKSLLILLFVSILPLFAQYRVIGYYPEWMQNTLAAEKIKFEDLTHVNHAFAGPDGQGNFSHPGSMPYQNLNTFAHQNNTKVLLSLGGWGSGANFTKMAQDTVKRKQFIEDLLLFIQNNNYDGADFDWEFPETFSQRAYLTALLTETRKKFDAVNPRLLITMAAPVGNWYGQWMDFETLAGVVDWFNAMCYDFHGSWSSHSGHNAALFQPVGETDGSVEAGLNYLHNTRKIPNDQLTIGIPFYGKQFSTSGLYAPFSGPVTDILFNEVLPLINNGWTYHWDDLSKVPYLQNDSNTKLITFDDTVSVRVKCDWIKEQEYAGVMIWALGQDLINGNQPLLETIAQNLLNESVSGIANNLDRFKDFVVFPNYPNPFNPETTISFQLSVTTPVQLNIYNALGQRLRTLIDKSLSAGFYKVIFDAENLAAGVYFYDLQSDCCSEVHKMILSK